MKHSSINIDFHIINGYDPRVLSIYDVSHWKHLLEKNSVIDIKTPGNIKYVRNYYSKNSINNFNSVNLNINCFTSNCEEVELIDLPDGHYEIKVLADGGYEKIKNYFRTVKLELDFDVALINMNLDCEENVKQYKDKFIDFKMYLSNIEAHIRRNNVKTAQKYYEMAEELVKGLQNCLNKDCY